MRGQISSCQKTRAFTSISRATYWRFPKMSGSYRLTVFVGGGGGIRTHEGLSSLPVFKTGAFNRSATPPTLINQAFRWLEACFSETTIVHLTQNRAMSEVSGCATERRWRALIGCYF